MSTNAAENLYVKQVNVQRNQKTEQRETRHRLHDIGEAEDRFAERRLAGEKNSEGNADENRDTGRNHDQNNMLEGQSDQLRAVARKKIQQAHAGLPTLWLS